MLNNKQLTALQKGLQDGFLADSAGLLRPKLVAKRTVYDEVRGRALPTQDFKLTGWGCQVAMNYAFDVERLPVGTVLNHRIRGYANKTVLISDDSGEPLTVDTSRPLRVSPNGHAGSWDIPLVGGGHTPSSSEMGWYLRNLLDMDIRLELGEYSSVDDFTEH